MNKLGTILIIIAALIVSIAYNMQDRFLYKMMGSIGTDECETYKKKYKICSILIYMSFGLLIVAVICKILAMNM